MAPLTKKRKESDLDEEDEVILHDSEREMHLQKMKIVIGELRNESGDISNLLEELLQEVHGLCESTQSNRSLRAIVDGIVDSDDSSDDEDETPTESMDEGDRKWEIMYRQLFDFRVNNGHCKVPHKFPENQKLAYWVNDQRKAYARGKNGKGKPMKPERIAKLERLGMSWGKNYPPPLSWDDMFQKLVTYRDQMGDCNVYYNPENPTSLAMWVVTQRKERKLFKRGERHLITLEQIKKLNGIGFKWKNPKK